MNYKILADSVMILHALMVVAVFLGILLSVRYKRFRPKEAGILLSLVVIWSLYGGCPLTYLENYLRVQSGNMIPLTDIGFISYYLNKWSILSMTKKQTELATYAIVLVFFAISVEWLNPFINPEIIKLRKLLKSMRQKIFRLREIYFK